MTIPAIICFAIAAFVDLVMVVTTEPDVTLKNVGNFFCSLGFLFLTLSLVK